MPAGDQISSPSRVVHDMGAHQNEPVSAHDLPGTTAFKPRGISELEGVTELQPGACPGFLLQNLVSSSCN